MTVQRFLCEACQSLADSIAVALDAQAQTIARLDIHVTDQQQHREEAEARLTRLTDGLRRLKDDHASYGVTDFDLGRHLDALLSDADPPTTPER